MLEQVLPPRKQEDIPTGENVEEVTLSDYEPRRGEGARRGEAYDEDDDDDDEMGGGHRMQCAQQ